MFISFSAETELNLVLEVHTVQRAPAYLQHLAQLEHLEPLGDWERDLAVLCALVRDMVLNWVDFAIVYFNLSSPIETFTKYDWVFCA